MSAKASLKAWVRDACGQVLALTGLTAPSARLRDRLSIITFHRVLTAEQRARYPLPGLAVTPEELDAHLAFATRHFRCMPLIDALMAWRQHDASGLPILAVTFDDGQLDNYVNGLPVLDKHGVKASFYIPSQILEDHSPLWHDALANCIIELSLMLESAPTLAPDAVASAARELLGQVRGGPWDEGHMNVAIALECTKSWEAALRADWVRRAKALLPSAQPQPWDGFMTVDQMKNLLARGHEIGSHAHSHPLLPQCTSEELEVEIEGSKRRLEAALGAPVTTFCYPNGSLDERSLAMVQRAGYRAAVTTEWGSNAREESPFLLQRFDMNAQHAVDRQGRFSEARLAWRLSGLHPGLAKATRGSYSSAAA
ncbi:MAG: polysaccharide deacetylase family protein [Burkholderiaceae bacterium]